MSIRILDSKKYKGRTIETVWASNGDSGSHFWLVDGNAQMGFHSRKDAQAFINGERPRWGASNLQN